MATVVAASVMGLLLVITSGAVYVGAAVIARHRAQSAADMAALAGAAVMPDGPAIACSRASDVARAMGGTVTACEAHDLDVIVTVGVSPGVGASILGTAAAVARAGPSDTN
jgi:secretion/DNA translocation related TadE-like protein